MNREKAFALLSELDGLFIAEAVSYTPENVSGTSERKKKMKVKRIITVALAAVLVVALGVTAYAVYSSMSHRVPQPEEVFRIKWEDNPSGYIEWTDAKLAVTFPETAESSEIQFCTSWLPEEMVKALGKTSLMDWRSRFTAESLALLDSPKAVSAYAEMSQPLQISRYAMSQFNNGGALLLLYHTPEEIHEEHWDELNVDVMYFRASMHLDAAPQLNLPERTTYQNLIVMSNTEGGWIITLAGELDIDTLLEVARNLKIRETGDVLRYEDFDRHFAFFDGGVG